MRFWVLAALLCWSISILFEVLHLLEFNDLLYAWKIQQYCDNLDEGNEGFSLSTKRLEELHVDRMVLAKKF